MITKGTLTYDSVTYHVVIIRRYFFLITHEQRDLYSFRQKHVRPYLIELVSCFKCSEWSKNACSRRLIKVKQCHTRDLNAVYQENGSEVIEYCQCSSAVSFTVTRCLLTVCTCDGVISSMLYNTLPCGEFSNALFDGWKKTRRPQLQFAPDRCPIERYVFAVTVIFVHLIPHVAFSAVHDKFATEHRTRVLVLYSCQNLM